MLFFLTLIITIYKVKNMPAIPSSLLASLFYGISLLLSTLPIGEYPEKVSLALVSRVTELMLMSFVEEKERRTKEPLLPFF
jgi:hypothetical protein